MENDEVTRRRDLLIQWSKRLRRILRDLITESKPARSDAMRTPLEVLAKYKTAHAPASCLLYTSPSPRDS